MDKIILTDADGVLVNWDKGFNDFATSRGLTFNPEKADEYNVALRYNISHEHGQELVTEFNTSDHISRLEPMADSVKYVKQLSELGFKFIVVTSISDDPSAKVNRAINLKNLFGDVFTELHCLQMGSSKYDALARWGGSGYFWIEDHMRQAESGYEQGLRPILITHPYNQHYSTDLFPRVSKYRPWEEIFKIICDSYNL